MPSSSRIVLTDSHERIIAVLGGIPPGSVGEDWSRTSDEAKEAVEEFRGNSTFTQAQQHGRRGNFSCRTVGFGYGNGRAQPLNFRVDGESNRKAVETLLKNPAIRRIAGFHKSIFNSYAHKMYQEYKQTQKELIQQHPNLCPNFPGTPFAALSVNAGPQSYSPPHRDADNAVHGWCIDTALGNFDPDKGGHLVLWDLGLAIRFPPGATIAFPSALITHSSVPIQKGETRYALIQFSSGGLFRWRANGFQSDKSFASKAEPSQLAEWEVLRRHRWKLSLQKFTRWGDLVQGDWKGQRRTQAGLDDVSELSDADAGVKKFPVKRSRHR
ncbi:hypothetical protein DFJ43DRAFT_1009433 [Lentinula guzmanii]|uniref:Uncharacterized protein n=1 Tax=Lentinula guzmanii TaxID=2804957 RepID=A0AA38J8U8_9AGAR|nr:hypothetical protein DFJ43DRAFT_1009433 [Lentinula guzmanii]